jgi:ATP-dependent DNA helicase RecG
MEKLKESSIVEFKKSTAELKQALEDICAFANTGEGTIYFGITDAGEVIGQDVSDDTIKRVSTTILSSIEPRVYPNVYEDAINGKQVLVVEVKNGPDKPYFYKGKAYKRVGTSNAYLSRYEVEKYLYERDNPAYRFDKTILPDYRGKIDKNTLRWFIAQANEKRNIPKTPSSAELILQNIGAYTNSVLNLGGILAFGKNIQGVLLNATVKCAVFEGVDKTGRMLDHMEIRENVFSAIDMAEQFVLRNLKKSAWINPQTGRREEHYEIPYLAIREAISNAVAHRDYRLSGNIDVAIFDDRIEVWSPGTLPHGITLRDIRSKRRFSFPRNPVVSEALFLTGYIEKWGSGIMKMNNLMLEDGLTKPEYEECFAGFLVTFYKRKPFIKGGEDELAPEVAGKVARQVSDKYPTSARQVTPQEVSVLQAAINAVSRSALQQSSGLKDREHFVNSILKPFLDNNLLEMTIPAKPRSSKQRYRLTERGKRLLVNLNR